MCCSPLSPGSKVLQSAVLAAHVILFLQTSRKPQTSSSIQKHNAHKLHFTSKAGCKYKPLSSGLWFPEQLKIFRWSRRNNIFQTRFGHLFGVSHFYCNQLWNGLGSTVGNSLAYWPIACLVYAKRGFFLFPLPLRGSSLLVKCPSVLYIIVDKTIRGHHAIARWQPS